MSYLFIPICSFYPIKSYGIGLTRMGGGCKGKKEEHEGRSRGGYAQGITLAECQRKKDRKVRNRS